MNKKLLALAVGAAIAMPVVALAEGPTLYGQLDASLDNVRAVNPPAGAKSDVWNISSNASRVGIKGSADTGVDGLKGIYLAEFGVYVDDGAATLPVTGPFTQRNIYAGLQGGFGTVLMGNVDTPTKSVQGKVDQFNDTAADIAVYVAGEKRAPNILAYATPKIADSLTVTVAAWQSEINDDNVGEALSASVVYEQDAIYAGLGIDKQVPGLVDVAGAGVAVGPASANVDIIRAVVGYSTDTVEVGFLYQTADDLAVGTQEDTSMVLSGAFKTGDMKIKAQYGQTEGDTGAPATLTETNLALGVDYLVGKATTVYGLLAMGENDAAAAMETQTFSFGIKQKF